LFITYCPFIAAQYNHDGCTRKAAPPRTPRTAAPPRARPGADNLADYELLEYLLGGVRRQGDTKPTAKALIDRFGSIAGVLAAPTAELAAVKGVSEATIALIAVTAEAARRAVREEIADGPVLSSLSRLIDYLRVAMGHNRTEVFRLLFLDSKNRLIVNEVQGTGTVNRGASRRACSRTDPGHRQGKAFGHRYRASRAGLQRSYHHLRRHHRERRRPLQ